MANGFREIFEQYGGNYADTMARFMDDEAMYLQFLEMFFQDENLEKLGKALKENQLEEAFDAAHTLKGVAGNMGLTPLYDRVCEIVEPLRSRTEMDYTQLYQNILEDFEQTKELQQTLSSLA